MESYVLVLLNWLARHHQSRKPSSYSSSLSEKAIELTPWLISPPPRQEARFFLAISFLKPLPFTLIMSIAAASPHVSPASSPNFSLALWVLSLSRSSLMALDHFSQSIL